MGVSNGTTRIMARIKGSREFFSAMTKRCLFLSRDLAVITNLAGPNRNISTRLDNAAGALGIFFVGVIAVTGSILSCPEIGW